MKIKKNKLFLFLPILYILGYWRLLPSLSVGQFFVKTIIGLAGLLFLLLKNGVRRSPYMSFAKKYLLLYGLALIVGVTITWMNYRYTLSDLVLAVYPYTYAFLAFPIIYCFIKDNGYERYTSQLIDIAVVLLLIKTVVWFLYNYLGIELFPRLLFEFSAWTRSGMQRMFSGFLVGIILSFSFTHGFYFEKRMKYKFMFAFIAFFLIFETQYRYQIASAGISVLFMYFYGSKSSQQKMNKFFLLVPILLIVYSCGAFDKLIESFAVTGSYGNSTSARLLALNSFWNQMTNRKAFLGLGLLVDSNFLAESILKYEYGVYYLEDLGIVGGFFRFGILSILQYGFLFVGAVKVCIKTLKNHNRRNSIFIIGVTSYMIISCLALNIFDGQRAFDVPVYIALISYINGIITYKERGD